MSYEQDIRDSVRHALANEKARVIVATAVGELIRNVGVARRPAERDLRPVISGLGGFVAGAGAATVGSAAVRGVRKLARTRPLEAVDIFAAKLPGRSRGPRQSGPARTDGPRPASGVRRGSASATRSSNRDGNGGRKTARGAGSRTAKRPPGTSARSGRTAKASRSANGKRGRTPVKTSA